MGAIAGIYHLNNEPIELEHGMRMMKELEKFPADDVQTWHGDKVFLGCHAQWITPESIDEKLPYYDSERKLAITADAIIDNREELFEKLQIQKHRRKTITDSELILLSYHRWREETPTYLIGDFAFMIWDEKQQQFFGARDPSGYRMLYYYKDSTRFSFCSTIEPLLSLPYIDTKLNQDYLAEFIAISGMIDTFDANMTPYMGIEQVPPFHSITITRNKISITKYGEFNSGEKLKLNSDEEYVEAFQDIFQKAVLSKLRTYRNIGSQLSGGLDSGSVVSYAADELRGKNKLLHTISYIPPSDFKDFTNKHLMADERPFIKKTVDYVGGISDHYYNFAGRNSYEEIDEFLNVMEMPYKFFENSFWLRGMFEEAHNLNIGVLLNGDKGNSTISWGTALDYYAILLKRFHLVKLYKELNHYSRNINGPRLRLLPIIARIGFQNIKFPISKPSNPPRIINSNFALKTGIFEKLKERGMDNTGWIATPNVYEQRRITFEDMYPWNSGNTLISKLSLRYSLWKRDPTNDIRVVRFCLSVPEEQCVQNGIDRALIRRATNKMLPDDVRLNQTVRGIQGADWVHRMIPVWGKFIGESKNMLSDSRMLGFVDEEVLTNAFNHCKKNVRAENITDPNYRILMRSLIVYRFLKKFT